MIQPRFILTNRRAIAIVTIAYGSVVLTAGTLFRFVEWTRGIDDARDGQASALTMGFMGVLWFGSLVAILRGKKGTP